MVLTIILMVVMVLTCPSAYADNLAASSQVTIASLTRQIEVDGLHQTSLSLSNDSKRWPIFISNVSNDGKDWTSLAIAIYYEVEGKRKVEIHTALQESLLFDPVGVLEASADQPRSLKLLCGPSAYSEYDRAEDSDSQRFDAVASVIANDHDHPTIAPALLRRLNKCADLLDLATQSIQKKYSD